MATGNPIKSQMVFCRGFPRYYATWVLFSVVRRFGIYGTVSIFSRWIVFPLHQAFWHGQVLRVRTETETAAPARGQPAAGPRCSGGRVAHVFPLTGSGPPPSRPSLPVANTSGTPAPPSKPTASSHSPCGRAPSSPRWTAQHYPRWRAGCRGRSTSPCRCARRGKRWRPAGSYSNCFNGAAGNRAPPLK